MAAPKTPVWDLEPHTRAKHAILKRYLQAWVPILSLGGFPRLVYIDGFAGPGRYSRGEDGSPVIALRAALDHSVAVKAEVIFLFVEKDVRRAAVLRETVDGIDCPSNFRIEIVQGQTFESAFVKCHRFFTDTGHGLPPTFAFIDPFGWTGAPFKVVETILAHKSCEVLVTFMYEEINRFIGHPNQEANFDAFFGTPDWRACLRSTDPTERNRILHDLYLRQLRDSSRAKYVRSFEMRNENDVTDYFLFYATSSLTGLKKMKEAMWKVDDSGEFVFSDATNRNQMVLFNRTPDFGVLQDQIVRRFTGQETTVGEVEDFVVAHTAFRESHYKVQVLRRLELAEPPALEVLGAALGRRKGTYGDRALRLRFSWAPDLAQKR